MAAAPADVSPPVLNIIATHKLVAKTTRCLAILYPSAPSDAPAAVEIRAKGPVATKAITLVEIVKRRIEEKGDTWWQYNALQSIEPQPTKAIKNARTGTDSGNVDEDGEEDEDPFTPYAEKPKKQPAVPLLTVYISLSRIPSLAEKCGEQTNASAR